MHKATFRVKVVGVDYLNVGMLQHAADAITSVGAITNDPSFSSPIYFDVELEDSSMWDLAITFASLREELDLIASGCFLFPERPARVEGPGGWEEAIQ
jgi:hypothetical protein